jgi:hypothetical protein
MQQSGQQTGKRPFVLKKAYEISYAVFRVGSRIANAALKDHLERQALSLLDAAAVENYGWVATVSRAIEYLVRFGSDVGLIHEANGETIISQLHTMDAGIAGPEKSATAEEVPLADIFSGHDPLFPVNPIKRQKETREEPEAVATGEVESMNGEMRQNAILEKIRQSGNCRIKDLQELLPDCSERTLRYDLQALMGQNLIERVGSGGPAIFYRIRQ